MEIGLSDDQQLVRETTRRALAVHSPMARVQELTGDPVGFDRDLWAWGAELGWYAMPVPEHYGRAVCRAPVSSTLSSSLRNSDERCNQARATPPTWSPSPRPNSGVPASERGSGPSWRPRSSCRLGLCRGGPSVVAGRGTVAGHPGRWWHRPGGRHHLYARCGDGGSAAGRRPSAGGAGLVPGRS